MKRLNFIQVLRIEFLMLGATDWGRSGELNWRQNTILEWRDWLVLLRYVTRHVFQHPTHCLKYVEYTLRTYRIQPWNLTLVHISHHRKASIDIQTSRIMHCIFPKHISSCCTLYIQEYVSVHIRIRQPFFHCENNNMVITCWTGRIRRLLADNSS